MPDFCRYGPVNATFGVKEEAAGLPCIGLVLPGGVRR